MEQLKPYLYINVVHHSEYNADPSENKQTKIRMRECKDSDFSRKAWILAQYHTHDYFKPFQCFDNVEDMYLSGSDTTYDEPRGWVKIDFKECKT